VRTGAVSDRRERAGIEPEFEEFANLLPEAIIGVDEGGVIVLANTEAERVFGYAPSELAGKSVDVLLPERYRAAHAQYCSSYFGEPCARALRSGLELQALRNDGSEFAAEISLSALRRDTGTLAIALIRNLGDQSVVQQLRALMESSDDAIIGKRLDGTIISWNQGAERIYGYREDEVIGRPVAILAPPERKDELVGLLRRIARGERVVHLETERVRKDGKRVDVSISISPLHDASGAVVGATTIGRDVTEQNRAHARLAHLNEELEERVGQRTLELQASNRELEAFAYSVSHDLRAPLRAIDGFSQRVLKRYGDRLGADGVHALERVRAATQRMGQLIDEILELSRLGRRSMRCQRVDLSALVSEIVTELRDQEPDRNVQVIVKPWIVATGDPALLRAALVNLLSNAFKFTGETPAARVEFDSSTTDGETVFSVRDNGAGFDMAYADKLFRPFERLHNERRFTGTGVGLAIVQRVVLRHGGRIWAQSTAEEGATFFFTLAPKRGTPRRSNAAR
jgi:PAS domain S-box-containing protein